MCQSEIKKLEMLSHNLALGCVFLNVKQKQNRDRKWNRQILK